MLRWVASLVSSSSLASFFCLLISINFFHPLVVFIEIARVAHEASKKWERVQQPLDWWATHTLNVHIVVGDRNDLYARTNNERRRRHFLSIPPSRAHRQQLKLASLGQKKAAELAAVVEFALCVCVLSWAELRDDLWSKRRQSSITRTRRRRRRRQKRRTRRAPLAELLLAIQITRQTQHTHSHNSLVYSSFSTFYSCSLSHTEQTFTMHWAKLSTLSSEALKVSTASTHTLQSN